MAKAPATIIHASIVSRETVRMALIIATLNDLEVKQGDILNACEQATCDRKGLDHFGSRVWQRCQKNCSDCQSLIWSKVSRSSFFLEATLLSAWNHWDMSLVRLTQIEGLSQKSDQKMGHSIISIIMLCEYILCIHHNADTVPEWLHKSFPLKPGNSKSDMYLGAQLHKTRLYNGVWAWAMSPVKYVQEAVRNCTAHLVAIYGGLFRLPKRAKNLLKMGYDMELDASLELNPDVASSYLTIISILRWKLGRIDVTTNQTHTIGP